ncbi:MAG: response regulator [Candidatus Binatia bacterium]
MIKVLLVDDHAVVRTGLKQILERGHEQVLVGEAGTGDEALQKVRLSHWDAVVLDISLPDRSGLDVLKQIKSLNPKLGVLVLTMHGEQQYAVRALRAGATGFLTKQSAPEELMAAICQVARGGRYVSPPLAERLAFDLAIGKPGALLHEALSDREFQVLSLLASGKTITDISRQLCVSVKTVSTHRARLLKKMRMRNNAELIQYAIRSGLVP